MSEATPTPAFAVFKFVLSVLTTFKTPPYDKNDDALCQYSYCASVESGLPKTFIKSSSVDTCIGSVSYTHLRAHET